MKGDQMPKKVTLSCSKLMPCECVVERRVVSIHIAPDVQPPVANQTREAPICRADEMARHRNMVRQSYGYGIWFGVWVGELVVGVQVEESPTV